VVEIDAASSASDASLPELLDEKLILSLVARIFELHKKN
jgi:hypothetical protein